jgi:extradiol dioxygenase family protein
LKSGSNENKAHHNAVDGHDVPVPHFGVVLTMEDWEALADRLRRSNTAFVIEPQIRSGSRLRCSFSTPQGMLSSSNPLPI